MANLGGFVIRKIAPSDNRENIGKKRLILRKKANIAKEICTSLQAPTIFAIYHEAGTFFAVKIDNYMQKENYRQQSTN